MRATGIVPKGATLEKIFDGGVVLTEGCIGSRWLIYFLTSPSAISAARGQKKWEPGHIWEFDPENAKKATIFRSPSGMSNGIKFDAEGNMIVAEGADYGGRRVIKTDMKTGKSYILAAKFEGRSLNSPNDISIDEQTHLLQRSAYPRP